MRQLTGSDHKKTKKGHPGLKKFIHCLSLISLLASTSCYRVQREIEPQINYTVQDRYLKQLPSPFAPLSSSEKGTDWGKEYLIGIHFARSLDLYRAITALRRAEILLPPDHQERLLEIQYEILLCYYLGRRYADVDAAFTQSHLAQAGADFTALHDLLTILYDTYTQLGEKEKTCQILELIKQHYPDTYHTFVLSTALQKADFPAISPFAPSRPYIDHLLAAYNREKKSPRTASFLNALLPGTGYLYLGQRQTGITALLVNGLFIAASVHFFKHGPLAAGIITASFEAGWYFGGIYGGATEAKFYNERLYEKMVTPLMNQERLFPIFQLNYAF